jgi:hypothetical protein
MRQAQKWTRAALCGGAALVALSGCAESVAPAGSTDRAATSARAVAATYDTGTNPFHPCFRRPAAPAPTEAIPEIAGTAQPLRLTFLDTYEESLAASQDAIDAMEPHTLYAIEGTNLLVYTGPNGGSDLVDTYPHGANASSQISCTGFGMAPESWLVIVNWYAYAVGVEPLSAGELAPLEAVMHWSAEQDWIDVIHLNIQRITPYPLPSGTQAEIARMVAAGKMVVIAAGNGFGNAGGHIPTESIDYYSIPGIVAAGANDGSDSAAFSNLDPHVVMDGCGTASAQPFSYESEGFSGTSSSSPRITGYVLELLRQLRAELGADAGTAGGVLVRLDTGQAPVSGPLADGMLTVEELHEVIRKTADPTLAASRLDGDSCIFNAPRPVDAQGHDYHRIGYGKLSEHTLGHALAVLMGREPMPQRPVEDAYYLLSTTLRDAYW